MILRAVLKYLAPYVHRVAISDRPILAVDEQSVTFSYTPSGSQRAKIHRVTSEEFLRGFCQHMRPRGLQKVRSQDPDGGFARPRARTFC